MRRTRRNRNRNRNGRTRRRKRGGWFESFFGKPKVITKDDDSVVYLDAFGIGSKTNVWSSILLPPYVKTIESAKNICSRIDDIIKGLNSNGIIVHCDFTARIKDRITKLEMYNNNVKKQLASLKSTDSFDYEQLFSNFKEIQLYIAICKAQWVDRGIGYNLFGVGTSLL
jgi:hypothetical protein